MIRRSLMNTGLGASPGFRLRGNDVSRVEGLTDGVFALAVTLLVVSVEVPGSFDELMGVVGGLPAFAACFALLMWFWCLHYRFCRRYGVFDGYIIFLNSVLLFIVLFYVYPMKFVFRIFVGVMTGMGANAGPPIRIQPDQVSALFVLYGAGFGALFAVFVLMHRHALRRRNQLNLNHVEVLETQVDLARSAAMVAIALMSVAIALIASPRHAGWAGWVYGLIGVCEAVAGTARRRLTGRLLPGQNQGAPAA